MVKPSLRVLTRALLGATLATTLQCASSQAAKQDPQKDSPRPRARDLGIIVGVLPPGKWNAITDVAGVRVGHTTLIRGQSVRTGVTAILPHDGNLFRDKVPAAIYLGNGFGKLAGYSQVEELGNLETPIVLTNTLSVGTAVLALVRYTLQLPGNGQVKSANAVVGETNDGRLNDIRGMHVSEQDVRGAIETAATGPVSEGNVGAGTGTVAFGYKGGIGTSSRVLPKDDGGYTVGVLVQSNYGGVLRFHGVPLGIELGELRGGHTVPRNADGSCMVVVATDAPLDARNLKRLAKRAVLGLGRTGSYMSNGSGDYVIAFSTAYRIAYGVRGTITLPPLLANAGASALFHAVTEATEEAVYNSLLKAETMRANGVEITAIPIDRLRRALQHHGLLMPISVSPAAGQDRR